MESDSFMSVYISSRKLYSSKEFVRLNKFKKDIKTQGFLDRETWSLDMAIADWLLPKLKKTEVIINKNDIEINEVIRFLEDVSEFNAIKVYSKESDERSKLFGKRLLSLSIDKEESRKIAKEFSIWCLPRFKRLVEIQNTWLNSSKEYIAFQAETIWMFEQILDTEIKDKKRFEAALEDFGDKFLTLWW